MSDGQPFSDEKMYRTTINSYQYFGTTLSRTIGITNKEMRERLNGSSPADSRYYMITALALSKEAGQEYRVPKVTDWKLVPRDIVSGCLAKDTVSSNKTETNTSINRTN